MNSDNGGGEVKKDEAKRKKGEKQGVGGQNFGPHA